MQTGVCHDFDAYLAVQAFLVIRYKRLIKREKDDDNKANF